MPMPEAPMNEKDFLPAWKYKVGMARQFLCVQSISINHAVYEMSDRNLGFGVL